MSDLPMRFLAVLGGAAVGWFGMGGLLRLAARLTMTRQKTPTFIGRVLRSLGAVVLGWLAALWMFGTGLGGFGGPGGWGLGPGRGIGNGTSIGTEAPQAVLKDQEKEKAKPSESGPAPAAPSESQRVEVLGPEAVQRAEVGKQVDAERRYRLDAGAGTRLMTLAELKDFLRARQQTDPPLRQVILVLYRDSPERHTAAVDDLRRWIEEDLPSRTKGARILVDTDLRAQNAPAR
jgi:hypothetical protein